MIAEPEESVKTIFPRKNENTVKLKSNSVEVRNFECQYLKLRNQNM